MVLRPRSWRAGGRRSLPPPRCVGSGQPPHRDREKVSPGLSRKTPRSSHLSRYGRFRARVRRERLASLSESDCGPATTAGSGGCEKRYHPPGCGPATAGGGGGQGARQPARTAAQERDAAAPAAGARAQGLGQLGGCRQGSGKLFVGRRAAAGRGRGGCRSGAGWRPVGGGAAAGRGRGGCRTGAGRLPDGGGAADRRWRGGRRSVP